jgi:hypothetical protein
MAAEQEVMEPSALAEMKRLIADAEEREVNMLADHLIDEGFNGRGPLSFLAKPDESKPNVGALHSFLVSSARSRPWR